MNRRLRLGLIVAGGILGLMLISGIVIKLLVSGSMKEWFAASISDRTGAKVTIGSADFDVLRWLILRPAVTLHDVVISNPPGFPAGNVLEARTVVARVELFPLFARRVVVESISVDEPHIVVANDAGGRTNVEVVLRTFLNFKAGSVAAPPKAGSNGGTSQPPAPKGPAPPRKEANFVVNDVSAGSGTLSYIGEKSPYLQDISLRLRGFCRDESCQIQLSAKLFGGKTSNLRLEGHAGPFNSDSLPLDGALTTTVALAEVPSDLRREKFGAILAAPGDKAQAVVTSTVKGDLFQSITGPAKLVLSDVLIGKNPNQLMPLSGQAPGTLTASSLVTEPQFKLVVPDATLQLGKGQWKGSADLSVQHKAISGDLSGAIRDVEVNEFLSTFTTARDNIYGTLAMTSLTLKFAGSNGDDLANSLSGGGNLSITNGRLHIIDFLGLVKKVIFKTEPAPGGANTPFSSFTSDITIGGKKISAANITMDGPTIGMTGSGAVSFDHSIDFDVVAKIKSLGKIGPLQLPPINASVPLSITGTLESPKVTPKIGQGVKSVAGGLVRDVESVIRRKK